MIDFCLFAIEVFLFFIVDSIAYAITKYPERTKSIWYKFPGGGIFCLVKYGTNFIDDNIKD